MFLKKQVPIEVSAAQTGNVNNDAETSCSHTSQQEFEKAFHIRVTLCKLELCLSFFWTNFRFSENKANIITKYSSKY